MRRRYVVFLQEGFYPVPRHRREEFVEGLAVRREGFVPLEEILVLGDDLQLPVVLRAGRPVDIDEDGDAVFRVLPGKLGMFQFRLLGLGSSSCRHCRMPDPA